MARTWGAMAAAVLAVAAASGCECARSHEIDGGGPPDATPIVDATPPADATPLDATPLDAPALDSMLPEGRVFVLRAATATVRDERCGTAAGATPVVTIQILLDSSCESPAPVDVAVDATTHTVTLAPHLWLEVGRADCVAIDGLVVREIALPPLDAGDWTIATGGTSLVLHVDPPSPGACSGLVPVAEGGACLATCDCDVGLSCVAIRGDAVCAARCQDPCERAGGGAPELGMSCPNGRSCESDPTVGDVCVDRTGACPAACPAGMSCMGVQCDWEIGLDASVRHPCTTNDDCETPGLDCVRHADGTQRCEVRCTSRDMRCPFNAPHACNELGICEWLGE